jgi:hypothetical protein
MMDVPAACGLAGQRCEYRRPAKPQAGKMRYNWCR